MDAKLRQQFRELKNDSRLKPGKSWILQNRERMLEQIAGGQEAAPIQGTFFVRLNNQIKSARDVFLPQPVLSYARPIVSFVMAVILAVGGWTATVGASYHSLPGDTLYNVKLATEKVQNAVTNIGSSGEQEIKRNIERAKRRSQEIKSAAEKTKQDPAQKLKVNKAIKEAALVDLDSSIKNVEENLEKMEEDKVIEVAKVVSKETSEIKKTLKEAKESLKELEKDITKDEVVEDGTSQDQGDIEKKESTEEVTKDVDNAAKVVDEVGMKALVNAVAKKGGEEKLKKVVKEVADDKINELKKQTDSLKEASTEFDKLDEEGKKKIGGTIESKISKEVFVSSTIAVESVDEVVEDIEEETNMLLEENKLDEVINLVREVTQAAEETEDVVKEVEKAVADAVEINNENENNVEGSAKSVESSKISTTTNDVIREAEE